MVWKNMLILAGCSFLMVGPAFAGTEPAAKCVNVKAKAAGKKAFDLLKAIGKNTAKNPDDKFGMNLSKAQSKFTKGFTKIEGKGACPTNGDVEVMESKVDAFVADIAGIPVCGNGVTESGEDCDDGSANGTPDSCCDNGCTFQAGGTPCTDTDGMVCTEAACDGAGACDPQYMNTCPNFFDCDCCQAANSCLSDFGECGLDPCTDGVCDFLCVVYCGVLQGPSCAVSVNGACASCP